MRLLRTFVSVASEQSFSRAADRLRCSQATVSQRVQSLESLLDRALFDRAYHVVDLTDAGRDFLPQAQSLLDHHDSIVERIHSGRIAGPVRLGVAEDYAQPIVARLMRAVSQAYPEIELSITCMLSPRLNSLIETRRLDLAIVTLPQEKPRSFVLSRPQLLWVAATDFAHHADRPWPVAFYNEGCVFRAAAERALSDAACAYRVALTGESGEAIRSAISSGTAIGVMAEGMIPHDYATVAPDRGLPQLPTTCIQLLHRDGDLSNAAMQVNAILHKLFAVGVDVTG